MAVHPNGSRIKELRYEKGWTQEELARRVGCSKKTIENGETGRPVHANKLAEIAEALAVEMKELVLSAEVTPGFLRLDAQLQPFRETEELLVDLGFFRFVLKNLGEPTNPVFCGCGCAWVIFDLDGGRSRA